MCSGVAQHEGSARQQDARSTHCVQAEVWVGECVRPECGGEVCSRLGDADNARPQGHAEHEPHGDEPGRIDASAVRPSGAAGWDHYDLVRCVEPTKEPGRYVEKRRRVESGTLPLAHGVPGRVGLLRGYGNAIVPQVAAEFIQAYMEIKSEGANQ